MGFASEDSATVTPAGSTSDGESARRRASSASTDDLSAGAEIGESRRHAPAESRVMAYETSPSETVNVVTLRASTWNSLESAKSAVSCATTSLSATGTVTTALPFCTYVPVIAGRRPALKEKLPSGLKVKVAAPGAIPALARMLSALLSMVPMAAFPPGLSRNPCRGGRCLV